MADVAAIAAAAIASGALALPAVAGELVNAAATGISAAIGSGAVAGWSLAGCTTAEPSASAALSPFPLVLSGDLLSLVFDAPDFDVPDLASLHFGASPLP